MLATSERTYPQPEGKNRELSEDDAWLREALADLGELPDDPDLAQQATDPNTATTLRAEAMHAELASFPRNPHDKLNTNITNDLIAFRRKQNGAEANIAARDTLRMDGHHIPEPSPNQADIPSVFDSHNTDAAFTQHNMNELTQMLDANETANRKPRGVRALVGRLALRLKGENPRYTGRHRHRAQHRQ